MLVQLAANVRSVASTDQEANGDRLTPQGRQFLTRTKATNGRKLGLRSEPK